MSAVDVFNTSHNSTETGGGQATTRGAPLSQADRFTTRQHLHEARASIDDRAKAQGVREINLGRPATSLEPDSLSAQEQDSRRARLTERLFINGSTLDAALRKSDYDVAEAEIEYHRMILQFLEGVKKGHVLEGNKKAYARMNEILELQYKQQRQEQLALQRLTPPGQPQKPEVQQRQALYTGQDVASRSQYIPALPHLRSKGDPHASQQTQFNQLNPETLMPPPLGLSGSGSRNQSTYQSFMPATRKVSIWSQEPVSEDNVAAEGAHEDRLARASFSIANPMLRAMDTTDEAADDQRRDGCSKQAGG
ncbi:hypothetical protein LTR64_008319 [Lithohypha guttulata]|uniref:uncharacterized protein n=1 Tax=Lithohypha guttulata TaxID=1690604 RepID=UPI002DE0A720|nr:hypothetical protein LTR51_008471 [Lithohypha guttulata]